MSELEDTEAKPILTSKERIAKIKEIIKEVYPFDKFSSDGKNKNTIHLKFIQNGAIHSVVNTEKWQAKIIERFKENNITYVSAMWQMATKQGYGPYQLFYVIVEK